VRALVLWLLPWSCLVWYAEKYGRITAQQVELERSVGWLCSIRAHAGSGPRYAWTGTGGSIRRALAWALAAAQDNPIRAIEGATFAPKLGGAEFDPE
jgi:hypothetical protein